MQPPNTVPITYHQFQELLNQDNPVYCHNSITGNWFEVHAKKALTLPLFTKMYLRILPHDYRHYFGDVVDLKGKAELMPNGDLLIHYLDRECKLGKHPFKENLWCISKPTGQYFEGTEAECKQHIVNHFTKLAAKDLPQYNLKFIFS